MTKLTLNNNQKHCFRTYLPDDEVIKGLEDDLLKGSLRLNPRNYKVAYITHPKLDSDILVYDKDINRALYDDIVAVKIHRKLDWKVLDEVINQRLMQQLSIKDKNGNSKVDNNNVPFLTIKRLIQMSPEFFSKQLGWDLTGLDMTDDKDFPDSCTNWWKYFQRTGHVVAIVHKMNSRFCVGSLSLPENAKTLSFVRFIPTDNRYPRLLISLTDCPPDFIKRPLDYKDVKFIARICDWNEKNVNPKGILNQCLQNMTMIDQETVKILAECGFEDKEFDLNILQSIPKETITNDDLKYRRDVRSECVFSIDPKTARDLDDALHIKELPSHNGKKMWEVGVHIADVSYYVTPDSEIDKEASKRTTTVYMVNKAVPMLPRELCENLCSLHPGSDKLSYSVIYQMTDDCHITDVWIGRTIMNSACKLSYEDAQTVLDNTTKTDWDQSNFGQIFGKFSAPDIATSILRLNHLAVQMRARRFDNGSLWINRLKIGFSMNEERTIPLGYGTYKLGASNHLIEEWMLQANITVAEFIHKHLPQTAFLRCHPNPTTKAIENINKQFKQMGWNELCLETGSTEEFQALMTTLETGHKDYTIMMNICCKAMQRGLYFCNNCDDSNIVDGCHHFALNVPLYTHFTSPIRRYPDVVVHRQITEILVQQQQHALLGQNPGGDDATAKLQWLARTSTASDCTVAKLSYLGDYCNKKKKDAKAADESSLCLFYCLFVEKSGPFSEDAVVIGVLDKAFDVLLTHCSFVRRVHFDQLDSRQSSFNEAQGKLTITWNQQPACVQLKHPRVSSTVSKLSEVKITVSTTSQGLNSAPKLKLVLPNPGCQFCEASAESAHSQLIDVSSLQSVMSIVDDNRLHNILDDI